MEQVMDWNKAYSNTISKVIYNKYSGIKSYVKSCKSCGSHTSKRPTRQMQVIGNCQQRIVVCDCRMTYVEDMIW